MLNSKRTDSCPRADRAESNTLLTDGRVYASRCAVFNFAFCFPGKVGLDLDLDHDLGRDGRIRTCDPSAPSRMRYQAAPRPAHVSYEEMQQKVYRIVVGSLHCPFGGLYDQ